LVSVFWWMAFEQRHRLLSLVMHERAEPMRRSPLAARLWLASRSAGAGVGGLRATGRVATGTAGRTAETVKRWREFPQPEGTTGPGAAGAALPRERRLEPVPWRQRRAQARGELAAQVRRLQAADAAVFGSRVAPGGRESHPPGDLAALEVRRSRLAAAERWAEEQGDRRRVVSLQLRRRRLEAELTAGRRGGEWGRGGGSGAEGGRGEQSRGALAPLSRVREVRALRRLLDQAARAPAGQVLASGARAAPLAGLVGISAAEYLRRSPGEQRLVRLEIERELARRRELVRERAVTLRGRPHAETGSAEGSGREGTPAAAPIARRARQFGSRPR
jgi:hypothetical protein